jgi:signal transduction histidine kinase
VRPRLIHGVTFLIIALIVLLANFGLYLTISRSLQESTELRLENYSDDLLVNILEDPAKFKEDPKAFILPSANKEFASSGIMLQIMDSGGKLLARSSHLRFNALPFRNNEDDVIQDIKFISGSEIKTYQQRIMDDEKLLGYLIVGVSTSQLNSQLVLIRSFLIFGAVLMIALLWLGISAVYARGLLENQRKFLGFASHELRTPLAVINGTADVALRTDDPKGQFRSLIAIKEETEAMILMVQNMLTMFRNESGTEKIMRTDFNLAELAAEAVSLIKKRYPDRNFVLNLPADAAMKADPAQISKILNNLLDNAAKNTTAGGRIALNVRSAGNMMVLEIEDNGRGIEKAAQKNIFDAYYSSGDAESKSIGLGLAIVKWAVKAHKGKIYLRSEPGNGSVFTVELPKR